jgi:hypothetical protein
MPIKTVIVSGPPRSGTSMVMQMLTAAGIETISDGRREQDHDNPRGYFEHQKVLGLAQDSTILADSAGKGVKIIHVLLKHIPPIQPIAVLFLHRDLDEVLASQAAMLERLGRPKPSLPEEQMRDALSKQIAVAREVLKGRLEAVVLDLQHRELVTDPESTADQIARFLEPHLGKTLNIQAMANCVDPSLYRQRH